MTRTLRTAHSPRNDPKPNTRYSSVTNPKSKEPTAARHDRSSTPSQLSSILHLLPAKLPENTPIVDTSHLNEESKLLFDCIIKYFDAKLSIQQQELLDTRKEVQELRDKVEKLEGLIDDNDAYERRDTLVMSGDIPSSTAGENCKEIIIDQLKQKLNINVAATDISVAHRLGSKPNTQQQDKRSLIFKLCRRDIKSDILDSCRRVRPNRFYINESLTPLRSSIMFVLRKAKQRFPNKIGGCRTHNGSVQVYIPEPGSTEGDRIKFRQCTVNTKSGLDQILQQQANCTSSAFIEEWRH